MDQLELVYSQPIWENRLIDDIRENRLKERGIENKQKESKGLIERNENKESERERRYTKRATG